MTKTQNDVTAWVGHTLVDRDGDKIGKISEIYMDEDTGQPEWIAVNTGRFGSRISFVPLAGATARGDDLQVDFTEEQVKDSPNAEADGRLSQDEEARLYAHYGFDYSEHRSDSGLPKGKAGTSGRKGRDTRGKSDDAMTRSEEELQVGKEQQETGRVRLRKYVVTENETRTVPVSREEVRIEREPITDANAGDALSGADISEERARGHPPRGARPWSARRPCRRSGSGSRRTRSPTSARSASEVRKERIETEGDTGRNANR